MKWMVTEDKLGADQKDVITEIGKSDKPIWIKGHAGSGKSVLLLHALKDFLVKHPNANVCIVVFTNALRDLLKNGLQQIPVLAGKSIPVITFYTVQNRIDAGIKYDAIFCDEIQDLPPELIVTLKASCTRIIVAGDSSQSIYSNVPGIFDQSPATPDQIRQILSPTEKNLSLIYRLTQSVLNILKNVFSEMLADRHNVSKVDTNVEVYKFEDDGSKEEVSFSWKKIKELNRLRPSEVVSILINGHDEILRYVNIVLQIEGKEVWRRVNNRFGKPDYEALNSYLNKAGLPLMYVGNTYGSLEIADEQNKIVLMTYHGAKGLDFDSVFLPLANEDMPDNPKQKELLLVALSRSKRELVISYTGNLFYGLEPFIGNIPAKNGTQPKTNLEDLDF